MIWWNNYDSIPPNLAVHDACILAWSKAILLYKTTFEKASTWLWWKSIQNHQICFKLLLLSLATNRCPNSRFKLSKIISITSNRKTNPLTGIYRDLSSICLLLNLIQFPCNFWWKCQVLSFWRRWLVPFCPGNRGITGLLQGTGWLGHCRSCQWLRGTSPKHLRVRSILLRQIPRKLQHTPRTHPGQSP